MKKLFTVLMAFSSIIGLIGCTAINKQMQSFQGQHYNLLIAKWGPPQQVLDDGQGGRIFVYTKVRQYTTPGSSTTHTDLNANASTLGRATYSDYGYNPTWDYRSNTNVSGYTDTYSTYTPPRTTTYNAYRMFWIDRNGYIYRWAWKNL